MLLYTYKCKQCGRTTEQLTVTHQASIVCECGAEAKYTFSPVTFELKGTGFYQTDYKRRDK